MSKSSLEKTLEILIKSEEISEKKAEPNESYVENTNELPQHKKSKYTSWRIVTAGIVTLVSIVTLGYFAGKDYFKPEEEKQIVEVIWQKDIQYKAELEKKKSDLNNRFEEEKRKYSSLAKEGFSISEEQPLKDVLNNVKDLKNLYARAGLDITPLESLINDGKKAFRDIETAKIERFDRLFVKYNLDYSSILITGKDPSEESRLEKLKSKVRNLAHAYDIFRLKDKKDKTYNLADEITQSIKDCRFKRVKVRSVNERFNQGVNQYNKAFKERTDDNRVFRLGSAARKFRSVTQQIDLYTKKYGLDLNDTRRQVVEWEQKAQSDYEFYKK